jgi:hypothetical protein
VCKERGVKGINQGYQLSMVLSMASFVIFIRHLEAPFGMPRRRKRWLIEELTWGGHRS